MKKALDELTREECLEMIENLNLIFIDWNSSDLASDVNTRESVTNTIFALKKGLRKRLASNEKKQKKL
ncbi:MULTISPECIES: hypothetical protein [Weeksella]|uniref:hypothetical protein n=1 Tax=Weeksella TaxID=1013 RepID=UPI0008A4DD0E|nr:MULTISPECIES: hypothetical protein [Weeksella]MDK7375975.1 hypothetical protein [Weeksella virosa]OFM84569.1 hypothetical protein HMPREF2660_08645 [Weeksella sp. HMSC059D05]